MKTQMINSKKKTCINNLNCSIEQNTKIAGPTKNLIQICINHNHDQLATVVKWTKAQINEPLAT